MNSLKTVVDLYRLSAFPDYDGESFSASIDYTLQSQELIKVILSGNFSYGKFTELEVDDNEIETIDELPEEGQLLEFTFLVSQSSAKRFYLSAKEFIKVNTLMRGKVPDQYYLIDLDYFPDEQTKPEPVNKIEAICGLIKSLSKLSHFHDMKNNGNSDSYRLVFILHSESKSSSAVIETIFSEELLNYDRIDISLINSLVAIKPSSDLHYDEKINTFRNTLIEYINSSEIKFCDVVKNWGLICQLYSNNLAVYMSAFSFQKARKEIAETEIEYADKISKITTEIANKALAIPISLIGSIAIYQLNGKVEIYITLFGLIFTSIIISLIIFSQKKQLNRVDHAKDIVFSSIEHGMHDDTSDLKNKLKEAKYGLKRNVKFCRRVLDFLIYLAWVPVYVGTLILLNKFL
ncbi:hypothetical protein [Ewingella americana]|uniref:Uncharacterized protein n=1 Tax=Ewingella americana TaxID=41202 RepID=A0A502GMR7_9GAMM|nr:hypothetical protein [Ewingella americana]TPG62580.1 hypothetical protein EAH77_08815 [Ewingella americana]